MRACEERKKKKKQGFLTENDADEAVGEPAASSLAGYADVSRVEALIHYSLNYL